MLGNVTGRSVGSVSPIYVFSVSFPWSGEADNSDVTSGRDRAVLEG